MERPGDVSCSLLQKIKALCFDLDELACQIGHRAPGLGARMCLDRIAQLRHPRLQVGAKEATLLFEVRGVNVPVYAALSTLVVT